MAEGHIQPTTSSCNAAMSALGRGRQWPKALQLFHGSLAGIGTETMEASPFLRHFFCLKCLGFTASIKLKEAFNWRH